MFAATYLSQTATLQPQHPASIPFNPATTHHTNTHSRSRHGENVVKAETAPRRRKRGDGPQQEGQDRRGVGGEGNRLEHHIFFRRVTEGPQSDHTSIPCSKRCLAPGRDSSGYLCEDPKSGGPGRCQFSAKCSEGELGKTEGVRGNVRQGLWQQ